MANDPPRPCAPVDLAPGVLLLPGFDGDGADPFLVPVNALVLGRGPCLLVIPGARRAPWAPGLNAVADDVHWIVSARSAPTPDLRLALARCRHAVPIGAVPAGERLAAGRFRLLDPPTAPVRSRAVLDVERQVLYSADAFGAPVLMPATDTDDLDDAYWDGAVGVHTGWAGADTERASALSRLGIELIVPAFGPVLRGTRLAAVLGRSVLIGASVRDASESDDIAPEGGIRTESKVAPAHRSPPSATGAMYAARMEELVGGGC